MLEIDGLLRLRGADVFAPAGPRPVSVVPGPGEPAEDPGLRKAPTRGAYRPFRQAVEAWVAGGTHHWRRVELADYPPPGAGRKTAYNRVHNQWTRELAIWRREGRVEGDFTSHVVEEGGRAWWTWGPKGGEGPPGPGGAGGKGPTARLRSTPAVSDEP